jgi:glycosyltransferase involved in cell wall biosynthesis
LLPSQFTTRVDLIIPVLNEEKAIGVVLDEIPAGHLRHIIVCDNGSVDQTAKVAAERGAIVVREPRRGYGSACLKGLEYLQNLPAGQQPEVVLFMDGDHSDFPVEIPLVLEPILALGVDLSIGSRVLRKDRERGALTPQQVFGNWLATKLIRWIYGVRFSDLGPFRAIRWDKLQALNMSDPNFGWTVEMQIKAAKQNFSFREVPVRYRKRIGTSKISGTISGTFKAGYKILFTIFKNW